MRDRLTITTIGLSILLVSIIGLGCSSCGGNTTNSHTSTLIFIDVTDSTDMDKVLTDEHVEQIIGSMGLGKNGNIFNGGEITFYTISDVSESTSKSLNLEIGNPDFFTGTPEISRLEDIEKFSKLIKNTAKEVKSEFKFGRKESEIFRNLKKSLENLNNIQSNKKNIIIFSDMLENSVSTFSLYKSLSQNEVSKLTDEYSQKLPRLDEVNIYIVPPINVQNKDLISKAEVFWTELFAKSQAKPIKWSVNLNMK